MKLIFLTALILLSNCVWYNHTIVEITNPTKMDIELDYMVYGDRTTLKGMIDKELFTGEIFSKKEIIKAERHRYPHVAKKHITRQNQYAYSRLVGNKESVIECFIHRGGGKLVIARLVGRCYFHAKKSSFDIFVEKKTIFDGFKGGLRPFIIN
jgi:hypothetical protein